MNDKAAAAEWRAAYERLLASVAFGAMNARSNSSSLECHEGTFEHILLEKATGRPDAPWDCFNTWLRTGSGIYWISGKPGSGKSTLMKFLTDHAGTMKGLRTWASRKEIRILKHFFWSAGNELEKDPKGFLLTMLHQAWTKDEVVAITLLQQHDHWKEKRTPSDWSVKHLREALKTTFHATRCSYCIFVDGLDECNSRGTESQDALLDYIQALGQELNIKFCVSSRPETIFNHRLYKHPKLRLQDLNKSDVELFVDEAFCGRLTAEPGRVISNEQERDLRADLIDSSNGVFLWVRLAVKTVLDGIRNGDDWEDLRARLNQTAGSLEALYKDMWDRLNEDKKLYRSEAALIFNHMIALGNQPSVLEVMLLLDEELRRKHLEAGIIPSNSDLAQKCQLVERRIPVRCAGLLEVLRCWDLEEYPDPPRTRIRTPDQLAELSTFYSTHITFIHRTAGDFLMGTEAGHQIQSHHPLTDAESCSVAVQAEIVAFRAGIFELAPELVVRFLCDARVEKVGAHNVALLEAIDMACALRIGQSDDGNNTKNWVTSMTITDA